MFNSITVFKHADTNLTNPKASAWAIWENVLFILNSVPITYVATSKLIKVPIFMMPLDFHLKVLNGKAFLFSDGATPKRGVKGGERADALLQAWAAC
eukprot:1137493-Pelagomonas_calceolata.AAC.2